MTGGGARAKALSGQMADAWIRFARSGDPNGAGLPRWAPFASGSARTMIFDNPARFEINPDAGEQASIA